MDELLATRQIAPEPIETSDHAEVLDAKTERLHRDRRGISSRFHARELGRSYPVLRPIAVAGAIILVGVAAAWTVPGLLDSIEQRALHRASVHPDHGAAKTHVVAVFARPRTLVYRDLNGTRYWLLTDETELTRFVNETLIYLDTERIKIKAETQSQIDALLATAFSDSQECIARYADWYFEWGRSWSLLGVGVVGGLKGVTPNNGQGIPEAARNEVEDYLIRNFQRFVLKPELRNPTIEAGLSRILATAHGRYLDTLTGIDNRIQHSLSESTQHLDEMGPLDKLELFVDWDAQKWKAPRYLADDAAFAPALRGVAVSALIAGTIGPTIERAIFRMFVTTASRVVAGLQPEIYGFVAGSVAEPGAGSFAGLLAGASGALLVDYISNRQSERVGRADFEQAGTEALNVTIDELSRAFRHDLFGAIDAWFDDARAIVAEQQLLIK